MSCLSLKPVKIIINKAKTLFTFRCTICEHDKKEKIVLPCNHNICKQCAKILVQSYSADCELCGSAYRIVINRDTKMLSAIDVDFIGIITQ